MDEVVLVQTAVPEYRRPFIVELGRRSGFRMRLFAGSDYFAPSIKTTVEPERVLTNRFLLGRRLLYQSGVVQNAVRADLVVLELNPRILSNWLILIARRVLRRPTVLWGHAWPRRGPDARSDVVRSAMRRLANEIIVYTESQARELRKRAPHLLVSSAPNAISARSEMGFDDSSEQRNAFIYVGRLVAAKRPDLLVRAFAAADLARCGGCRLAIVGDGPERSRLEALAAELGVSSHIDFLGQLMAVEDLRKHYARAVASVSPGYVGLSITQSLSFGVPMIFPTGEDHAPEIEAAKEGFTGFAFTGGDADALAHVMREVWRRRAEIALLGPDIVKWTAERYAIEGMVDCFAEVIRNHLLRA